MWRITRYTHAGRRSLRTIGRSVLSTDVARFGAHDLHKVFATTSAHDVGLLLGAVHEMAGTARDLDDLGRQLDRLMSLTCALTKNRQQFGRTFDDGLCVVDIARAGEWRELEHPGELAGFGCTCRIQVEQAELVVQGIRRQQVLFGQVVAGGGMYETADDLSRDVNLLAHPFRRGGELLTTVYADEHHEPQDDHFQVRRQVELQDLIHRLSLQEQGLFARVVKRSTVFVAVRTIGRSVLTVLDTRTGG